jgi:hypothetical protein
MGLRTIPIDLSLIRQAASIEHEFGPAALVELVRVARFLERAFYVPGSLARTASGIAFDLANPPLRTGAFKWARLLVDGTALPAEHCRVRSDRESTAQRFADLSETGPLVWPTGRPAYFEADGVRAGKGLHLVRLELRSVAIPPLVWIEFSDRVRREAVR